jgi:hypothetical protein
MTTKKINSKKNKAKLLKLVGQSDSKTGNSAALNGQYKVIRQDVLKLRADLARGYDLLRNLLETKISRRSVIQSK